MQLSELCCYVYLQAEVHMLVGEQEAPDIYKLEENTPVEVGGDNAQFVVFCFFYC